MLLNQGKYSGEGALSVVGRGLAALAVGLSLDARAATDYRSLWLDDAS